jgi:ATP-dependent RNA helicase RhlE
MTIFDKLNEHFESTFAATGIEKINPVQEQLLKRTKQGGDLLFVAPDKSGKTVGAALCALQKVPESYEGSPRVIIMCGDSDKAKEIANFLTVVSRRKELMIELAHDKGVMIQQRNHIFEGADIVVGTSKRIYDLYIQNGINFGMLNLFIVDDVSKLLKESTIKELKRIAGSLPVKCQKFFLTTEVSSKLENLAEVFLNNPLELEIEAEA